jgi:hypothetical protein
VVATRVAPFHELRLLEAMSNPIESLLQDDHRSLGELFDELDGKLLKLDIPRALELLDFFWARLAMHIRAENLHLFPALTKAPANSFTQGGLPTIEEAQTILAGLRADHDFFMKELVRSIEAMREMARKGASVPEEVDVLRDRLAVVKERLDTHNRLEEGQVYVWPSLLFDDGTLNGLCQRLRHELENLPPRFRASN